MCSVIDTFTPLPRGVAFAPPPRVGFYVLESRAEPVTPTAASELHKNCVMLVVDDRIGASAGCAEVDGEVREWLREAAEAEVSAAALRVLWAMCLAYDAACLPFGMVGELRRKLGPIALAVLLLFMGVGIMNIRVSAEFPCLRQRAAFSQRCRVLLQADFRALIPGAPRSVGVQ